MQKLKSLFLVIQFCNQFIELETLINKLFMNYCAILSLLILILITLYVHIYYNNNYGVLS